MLSSSRVLLPRCNYISRSKGLLEECVTNKKSVHVIQRLNFCTTAKTKESPLIKHNFKSEDSKPKNYDYSSSFKNLLYLVRKSHRDINKCLPALNRMISIYHNERFSHKLSFDLRIFLMSEDFERFCGSLHKHLPNFKPDVLITLLNMEHFGVPVNSILMQKVLVLILDNINSYNVFDKVFLYATISRKYFEDSEQCADLKKALDVYFETVFDQELEQFKSSVYVTPLMENISVPVKVKKKIAEKIICETISTRTGHNFLSNNLEAIFIQPIPLFSPDETIEILRKAKQIRPMGMLNKIAYIYKRLVQADDSFYNESFCDELADNTSVLFNKKIYKVASDLCTLGHLNDDLLKVIAERSSVLNFAKINLLEVLPVASIFARSCIHERNVLQPESWEVLKTELQLFNFNSAGISYSHLHLCELLTFLGCDTRNLFSNVFEAIEQNKFESSPEAKHCIVRFHHLAKVYFSNEFATLSDETLSRIMEKSAAENVSFPATLVEFIGGEDYLLKNCTTPDKHFLRNHRRIDETEDFHEALPNFISNTWLTFVPSFLYTRTLSLSPSCTTSAHFSFNPEDFGSVFPSSINTYFADYVAVLGPDNKPINLSSFKQKTKPFTSSDKYLYNIEDIERPSGSKVVVFQNFPDSQPIKFYNAPVMSGVAKIFLKSFEASNCDVVLLPPKTNSESLSSQLNDIIQKHEDKK